MSETPSDRIEQAALEKLTAADVMTPLSRTCSPFSTVTEAVMIFKAENCDVVPVVDMGKPLGIVIDRDVALAVVDMTDLGEQPVTAVMSKDVPSVDAGALLDSIVDALMRTGSRVVLVVDADSNLVGIVTRSELAKANRLSIDAMTTIPDAVETDEVNKP
jgi:CBS domain-containing protein